MTELCCTVQQRWSHALIIIISSLTSSTMLPSVLMVAVDGTAAVATVVHPFTGATTEPEPCRGIPCGGLGKDSCWSPVPSNKLPYSPYSVEGLADAWTGVVLPPPDWPRCMLLNDDKIQQDNNE